MMSSKDEMKRTPRRLQNESLPNSLINGSTIKNCGDARRPKRRARSVVAFGRGRGEGVAVARSHGGRAGSQNAGLDFAAGHGGRLPRAVARNLRRGRHGAEAIGKTWRDLYRL